MRAPSMISVSLVALCMGSTGCACEDDARALYLAANDRLCSKDAPAVCREVGKAWASYPAPVAEPSALSQFTGFCPYPASVCAVDRAGYRWEVRAGMHALFCDPFGPIEHPDLCTRQRAIIAAVVDAQPEEADTAVRALRAFKIGCSAGDAAACEWLATAHLAGFGVKPALQEARTLFAAACRDGSGSTSACTLGLELLPFGKRDQPEARARFSVYCRGGDALACSAVELSDQLATYAILRGDEARP